MTQPQGPYGQPPYGQPQYSQYGQPQPEEFAQFGEMGPMTTRFAMVDPGPSERFGIVGAVLAAVGAVLLIVSFTAASWFDTNGLASFNRVHQALGIAGSLGRASGLATAYFSWLAWVLLVAGVLLALLALAPNPLSGVLRITGALVGLLGVALTFGAIQLAPGTGYRDWLGHVSAGFWLAVAGFALVAVAAALGPRRAAR